MRAHVQLPGGAKAELLQFGIDGHMEMTFNGLLDDDDVEEDVGFIISDNCEDKVQPTVLS